MFSRYVFSKITALHDWSSFATVVILRSVPLAVLLLVLLLLVVFICLIVSTRYHDGWYYRLSVFATTSSMCVAIL